MIAWLINLILRPEFFGALALICAAGYVFFATLGALHPLALIGRWACAIAGIVFAVLAAYAWADNRGYARAEANYKPLVAAAEARADTAEKRADTAEAANATLAGNLKTLEATLAKQAAAVDKLKADQLAAQIATRAALARIAATASRYAGEIERLKAIATGPPAPAADAAGDATAADAILRADMRRVIEAEATP